MTNKSTIFFLLLGAVILSSCGAGKKLDNANAQIADLQSQNTQLTSSNNDLKKQVTDLTTQNKTVTDQFNSYKVQCQKNEQELKEVNDAMNELADNVMALQAKIDSAEAEFNSKGLEVHSENGVVYVDMQDNLLYKSGSAKLSEDGKKALGNLASVLSEMPKLKVIVVGNTDTVRVKGVADNWSLSTERANGVVRTLVKDYNLDPARLTAAGKGKFNPIGDNSTEEGRAKNRRTEIVLNPDWERLWESVKKQ
ncbi:MAG TPA: OmpA family protein [Chitinophagaceae bacterium]|jgi:chemotaxis protein MotB|nr:OmpA family protein [Chitinophagaceae bacterium]